MVWYDLRPIFNRLPVVYREPNDGENPSNWLTDFWDELLVSTKTLAEGFFDRFVDPETAESENLDWSATTLYGYLGEYWNPQWSDDVKRQLMTEAYPYLWVERGTEGVIEYLLDLHQIPTFPELGKVWRVPPTYAGVNTAIPFPACYAPYQFDIRLDTFADRDAPEWVESYRICDLYAPIWSRPIVGYKYWYAGLSLAGEAVYDYAYEMTASAADSYFEVAGDGGYDPLFALQWLLDVALADNPGGRGAVATVFELPAFIIGESSIPALAAEDPNYYVLFPPESTIGDADWQVVGEIVQTYAPQGSTFLGFDGFYSGIVATENPVLETPLDGTFRTVIVTVLEGIPSFEFHEPDFDYPDRSVYISMAAWFDLNPLPFDTLERRKNSHALIQWLFDDRGIAATVVDIPSAAIGITPLPFWVLEPDRSLSLSVQVAYNDIELDSENWEWAQRMAKAGIDGQSLLLGYDGFYSGVSPVENPLWETPANDPRYCRTVLVNDITLEPTFFEANNPELYPDRQLYEWLADYWETNPEGDTLEALQYLVDLGIVEPPTVYEVKPFIVGVSAIPSTVSDPRQPELYVVFPDNSVEFTPDPHPEGSTNLVYYY